MLFVLTREGVYNLKKIIPSKAGYKWKRRTFETFVKNESEKLTV